MRHLSLIITFLVFSCFWAVPWVAAQETGGGLSSALIPEPPIYIIQPNDVLEIVVWGEPDISRKVIVRPDGRISIPLVQDLRASELTPPELKEEIERRLSDYLDSPNATVIVEAIQSYKVYVTGKVQSPGAIISEQPITVLQALTLAGGFAEYANDSDVSVVRTYGREHVVFDFNYGEVIKGRRTHQNILLRSGDVIVVP